MSVRACAVAGCEKPQHARGWCDSHYRWSRDNGWAEPDYPLPVFHGGRRYRPVSTAYGRGREAHTAATQG